MLPPKAKVNKTKNRDKAVDQLLRMSSYSDSTDYDYDYDSTDDNSTDNDSTAGSSPLGILAKFPREIRDVVYEDVSKP